MTIVVHRPSPPLAPFVELFWYFADDLAHTWERVLPSGRMQILVNLHANELRWYDGDGFDRVHRLGGAAISGVHTQAIGIDTAEQRSIAGVVFRPGGAYPFLDPPADEIADTHTDLESLWGRDALRLRERLLEARTPAAMLRTFEEVLLARARRPLKRDRCIAFALDAFESGASVAEVTERVGFSGKHFGRLFAAEVGLTPKRFARLRRFQKLLRSIDARHPARWAELAIACGYHDQAHMIRDFKAFAGVTPSAYAPRGADTNHLIVE